MLETSTELLVSDGMRLATIFQTIKILLLSLVISFTANAGCEDLLSAREAYREQFKASNGPLWVEVLRDYETIVLRNHFEHVDPEVLVIALHGMGTNVSRAQGMGGIMNHLGSAHQSKPNSISDRIQKLENYRKVVVEAIALPGHEHGPPLSKFKSSRDFTNWLNDVIRLRKSFHGNIPVVVLPRSASNVLASSTHRDYPGLIEGLVFMSPTMPGSREVISSSEAFLRSLVSKQIIEDGKSLAINEPGFTWAKDFVLSESWQGESFGRIPTIMLFGGEKKDPEVSRTERNFSENLARNQGNIGVYTFDSLGHNTLSSQGLSPKEQVQVLEAYERVFDLIGNVVNRNGGIYYSLEPGPIIFNGGVFH